MILFIDFDIKKIYSNNTPRAICNLSTTENHLNLDKKSLILHIYDMSA